MDISQQIKDYMSKNSDLYETLVLDYEKYIKNEMGAMPPSSCESRDADDWVSIIGWETSADGLLDLIYTTMSGNMSHAIKICYKHGTLTRLHTHNYIELAYVVRGRLVQKMMDKEEVFCEGEICLADRESVHADYLLKEDSVILFLGVENTFFDQFLITDNSVSDNECYIKQLIARRKSEYDFVRFSPKDKGEQTQSTFEVLLDELLHTRPCKEKIVKGYVERLVHLLSMEYLVVLTKKERQELRKSLFRDIETYIQENYELVSVQKLAAIYNYSPDYLSRLCFKKTGTTLSQYIQKTRMEKAAAFLENTNLPVEQIARKVGYNNIGFFYRKFKEQYQTTPDKMRIKR